MPYLHLRTNIIASAQSSGQAIVGSPIQKRCTSTGMTSIPGGSEPDCAVPQEPPVVYPLPDGVDGSRVGLYEIVGTEGSDGGSGLRTIFGVHGPREHWPAQGGNIEAAGGGAFAIVEVAGKQYKVTDDDVLYSHKIRGEVNTGVVFDKVLLYGTMLWSVFGRPYIPGARVMATIESQTKTAKVMVTKYKKRKGYRRRQGHRQPITRLRIDGLEFDMPDPDLIVPHEVEYDPLRPPKPNNPRFI